MSGIFRIWFPYGDIGIFGWIDRILNWRGIGLGRCPEHGLRQAVFLRMHGSQMLRNRQRQPLILVIFKSATVDESIHRDAKQEEMHRQCEQKCDGHTDG